MTKLDELMALADEYAQRFHGAAMYGGTPATQRAALAAALAELVADAPDIETTIDQMFPEDQFEETINYAFGEPMAAVSRADLVEFAKRITGAARQQEAK